jgi:acyl transferase domain-containing protein/thioesterase domain-containing protein
MTGLEIAVIGLAGRIPGAPTIESFWRNLCEAVESIAFFSDEELKAAGVAPTLLRDPNYVKAGAVLDTIDLFDAAFFGMNPREADITDPQHRLFLECAWEALESAGYNPYQYQGAIGVYAGVGMSTYASGNPQLNRDFVGTADDYQTLIGNQKDFLTTRVAYKLGFRGPCVTIQTACSTSLVAVHLAVQGLISGDSDIALAGGVSVRVPHKVGYLYQAGGVTSPDGHCRAFDAQAQGTVIGSGVGIVVLKRLEDALADGDCVYAVIKGSAINNDGALKAGYMAPSVDGQSRVIRAAQRIAEVEPDTIGYIETHGTATSLGDPIEIRALTQAFQTRTQRKGFCAIGSLKTNIGHLDVAAGVAGLIKTILALKHRQIPPSLHFDRPNPAIDFVNSPFYVNTVLSEWNAQGTPRRAGVSAFGIGGTNAHVVLEEAPYTTASSASRPWQLLVLSARSSAALDRATANLAEHFRQHPDCHLADAAYTLQTGRHVFSHRRAVICRDLEDAATALETGAPQRVYTAIHDGHDHPVVFMFPGGGAQYVDMGRELYQSEPTFREQLDHCMELLRPHIEIDLRQVLYPSAAQAEEAARQLRRTSLALPMLFAVEYSLTQLWMSWGLKPQALIGHSLGEYVAACLSGVMGLEDALALVALRGQLFEQLPQGAMLSVPLSEEALLPLLDERLSLAAINGPSQCVASGPVDAIERLAATLAAQDVDSRRLPIDVAAHSAMLAPILEPFAGFVTTLRLQAPAMPYMSNVTGTWITAAEATDPHYWVRHLRQTVRFSDGINQLVQDSYRLFLEVGPGRTLSTLVKQLPAKVAGLVALSSLRHPANQQPDSALLMTTLGRLWLAGAAVEWSWLYTHERRHRVPLPTYPFERRRHWLAPPSAADTHCRMGDISTGIDNGTRPEQMPDPRLTGEYDSVALHERPVLPTTYVAPRDRIEQTLADIWQQVLGIEQVGIHDDFFELGGDSLQAVQALARIRDALPVELSPHCLLRSPTIAGLTQVIAALGNTPGGSAAQAERTHSSLVNIRPGSDKQPLFLVHPIGGGVYIYRDLARSLGPGQAVYGLQARGFEGNSEPLTRVEDMAAHYIDALCTVQPSGPYLLGGSSFGGVVAYEMAQQLRERGQEIALLALIDTATPKRLSAQIVDEDDLLALAIGADAARLSEQLQQHAPDERLRSYLDQARAAGSVPADFGLPEFRRFLPMIQAHLQAMHSYIPRLYPGSIVFFRAAIRDRLNPPDPEQGWIGLATGSFEVHEVPGDHITMNYAPHVWVMAERFNQYLEMINDVAVYNLRP